MIDAENITDYTLDTAELEARLIFWVFAAGKNGTRAANITNYLLNYWRNIDKTSSPFNMLMYYPYGELSDLLKQLKTGCHNIKAKTLYDICRANIDLATCTATDLEKIYGIGMKTSRCFIIHSRKDAQYAGLDTHMLKHLKSLGHDVPKSTPTKNKYLTLEKTVLILAKQAGKSPAEYDLEVWNKYKIN